MIYPENNLNCRFNLGTEKYFWRKRGTEFEKSSESLKRKQIGNSVKQDQVRKSSGVPF